jgi:DNA repair photolyase
MIWRKQSVMNAPASLQLFPAFPLFGPPETGILPLEKKLGRAIRRRQPVLLGTLGSLDQADPYDPAERAETRALLRALANQEGIEVSITTHSPLLLHDLALLTELDHRHAVTIQMAIPSLDPDLARRLEPRAPAPRLRMDAVRRLAEEGIETRVLCAPVRPGINNGERILRPLFAEAREAGAADVLASASVHHDPLLATFRRLRLEHGFPQALPGRG